jgi:predicted dehydrogenase
MWLIGAGYWGSKLLENLKKFDINATIIDIRNGQTIDDINTQDPVMLATPLWQHHEQTCALLARGHDVYVEKPMAETFDQILDIEKHVAPGQLLMVGHLFVHHPQMSLIREQIASGIIGDIVHITSRRLNWGIYQTKTDPL